AGPHEGTRGLAEEQAEMEKETQSVRAAGAALDRISQVAEQSARLVEGISHSANDQVLATQDLVVAIQRIAEVSRLIFAEASHVRADAQSLARRAQGLLPPRADAAEPPSRPEMPAVPKRRPLVESSR